MVRLDRAHSLVVEWLCSAERTPSTRAAFGEGARYRYGTQSSRSPLPVRLRSTLARQDGWSGPTKAVQTRTYEKAVEDA